MEQKEFTVSFGYFYGDEVQKFQFYMIPKLLFTNEHFKSISTDSKVLYGMMLDRTRMSAKNKWTDSQSRVYIFYPVKEIMEDLGVCNTTVTKMLKELETIGLIERKKQGLNRADMIFVKNFAGIEKVNARRLNNPILGDEEYQSLDTVKSQSPEMGKLNTNNKYVSDNEVRENKSIKSKGKGGFFNCGDRNYSPEFFRELEAMCCGS